MKKLLFLTALLTGCAVLPPPRAPYPVELPHGIRGTYVECSNELFCQARCVGVCKKGYWIAETMYDVSPPNHQVGIVIVCQDDKGE